MKMNKKTLLLMAKNIKAVAMDVDGCLLPDVECLLPEGKVAKFRSRVDGQGISLMRAIGIKIVFITAEKEGTPGYEPIKRLVDNWNHLPSSKSSKNINGWQLVELFGGEDFRDKGSILVSWLKEKKIKAKECVVMGDDLVDIPMLKVGGLKIAPASAELSVKKLTNWITERPGGYGAVRDLANLLVLARGIDPVGLPYK